MNTRTSDEAGGSVWALRGNRSRHPLASHVVMAANLQYCFFTTAKMLTSVAWQTYHYVCSKCGPLHWCSGQHSIHSKGTYRASLRCEFGYGVSGHLFAWKLICYRRDTGSVAVSVLLCCRASHCSPPRPQHLTPRGTKPSITAGQHFIQKVTCLLLS